MIVLYVSFVSVFVTFLQLRVCPVQEGDEAEWEEEAEWIYNQAFCTTPISQQVCGKRFSAVHIGSGCVNS